MRPAFPTRQFVKLVSLAAIAWLYFGNSALPFAAGPISVMVVEETSDRGSLTTDQQGILFSHSPGSMLDWLKTHGEKDPDGAFRLIDKDSSLDKDAAKWQTMFAAKGAEVPWLVVSRGGKVLLSEALPKDAAATTQQLKRLGGE
jgi:hypothetical protein